MTAQAQRFLDIYAHLERHFRKQLAADNTRSFSVMVKELSSRDRAVGRFRDDLLQWHDLRNAIVHERRGDGKVIAEPLLEAVDEFEKIARILSDPPLLSSRFQREVARVSPTDMVSSATEIMRTQGFGQLPVYDGNVMQGLLTANTVARWLSVQWADGVAVDASVAEVLSNVDDTSHWITLGRAANYLDALHAFDDAFDRGKKLDAIVLTHSGKRTHKPIGILTAADIPELLNVISPD